MVKIEKVVEVGHDYVILPYHEGRKYSTISTILDDWDEEDRPEELKIMQDLIKKKLGKAKTEKEKIIEEIIIRSLIEPSGKTYYNDMEEKFIVCEPKITPEHLERWAELEKNQNG